MRTSSVFISPHGRRDDDQKYLPSVVNSNKQGRLQSLMAKYTGLALLLVAIENYAL